MTVTGRIVLDKYVSKVIEFMEGNLPEDKLAQTARYLPLVAGVIWGEGSCASLEYEPISVPPRAASESFLDKDRAGDGSVVAEHDH